VSGASRYNRSWPRLRARHTSGLIANKTREKLQKAGASLFEDSQENFKKFFHADIEKWRDLVKKTGLKLE
jgi:hypothetical protein